MRFFHMFIPCFNLLMDILYEIKSGLYSKTAPVGLFWFYYLFNNSLVNFPTIPPRSKTKHRMLILFATGQEVVI